MDKFIDRVYCHNCTQIQDKQWISKYAKTKCRCDDNATQDNSTVKADSSIKDNINKRKIEGEGGRNNIDSTSKSKKKRSLGIKYENLTNSIDTIKIKTVMQQEPKPKEINFNQVTLGVNHTCVSIDTKSSSIATDTVICYGFGKYRQNYVPEDLF